MIRRLTVAATAMLVASAVVLAAPPPANADSVRDRQWYLDALNIDRSHELSQGAGVTIGLIDSGVNAKHQDLDGNVEPGKAYGSAKDNGLHDDAEHGTGIASILTGHGHGKGHADGIMGIAPKSKIISVGISFATTKDRLRAGDYLSDAVKFLVDKHVDVISISMVTNVGDSDAIDYAASKGVPIVAAAGNVEADSKDSIGNTRADGVGWPADEKGVIPVTGTTQDGNFWDKSQDLSQASAQPKLGIAAPAVDMETASKDGGYESHDGTSGAAPIVAGTLALLKSAYPKLTEEQREDRLYNTVDDKGKKGYDDKFGWGIVDPYAALTKTVKHYNGSTSTEADAVPLDEQGKSEPDGAKNGSSTNTDKALSAAPNGFPYLPVTLTAAALLIAAAIVTTVAIRRKR